MSASSENIKTLFTNVNAIVKHQKEIEILKGENFNVFSILKMESKENATHSAFLGELLNPRGSHSKGNVFLKLFLEAVNYAPVEEEEEEIEENRKSNLSIDSASLRLEKDVGKKDIVNKTGGRIDIYIWDNSGNTISIENKIYAQDQEAQVARYCNHNKEKNTVYYLTLKGKEASKESSGKLEEGKDYYSISYAYHIANWLEACLKEASDHPILRESIKQYLILIKKLTNQLTSQQMKEDIVDLISANYLSSKAIANNIEKAELEAMAKFLKEIKAKVETELKEGWLVTIDTNLKDKWKGLRVTHDTWGGIKLKLEGDARITTDDCNYGVHAVKDIWNREDIISKLDPSLFSDSGFNSNHHWACIKRIFSMRSESNRLRLFDTEKRKYLVNDVAEKLIALAEKCESSLKGIERINKEHSK